MKNQQNRNANSRRPKTRNLRETIQSSSEESESAKEDNLTLFFLRARLIYVNGPRGPGRSRRHEDNERSPPAVHPF